MRTAAMRARAMRHLVPHGEQGREARLFLEFEMAEVLIDYDSVITADDGTRWVARACGRPGHRTVWEGWLEFIPLDAELRPIRSRRETTQPNRDDLVYWSTGLTPVYLKGALARTLAPAPRVAPARSATPAFEGPAPNGAAPPPSPPAPGRHSILDPFAVYEQGEGLLLRQLDALDTAHLRDIVRAYALAEERDADIADRDELTAIIVAAARRPART